MLASFLSEFFASTGFVAAGTFVLGFISNAILQRWSANQAFDHRLKLEKEYGLYADLWERLFELRRDLGEWVNPISAGPHPDESTIDERFNAYNSIVRRGEPFIWMSIIGPAREIARLAREIITNERRGRSLDAQRETMDPGDRIDRVHRIADENEAAFQSIEQLFEAVSKAIRARVSVPDEHLGALGRFGRFVRNLRASR